MCEFMEYVRTLLYLKTTNTPRLYLIYLVTMNGHFAFFLCPVYCVATHRVACPCFTNLWCRSQRVTCGETVGRRWRKAELAERGKGEKQLGLRERSGISI